MTSPRHARSQLCAVRRAGNETAAAADAIARTIRKLRIRGASRTSERSMARRVAPAFAGLARAAHGREHLPQRARRTPRELQDRVGAGLHVALADRAAKRGNELGAVT